MSELHSGILSLDESGDLRLLLDLIEFESGSLTLQRKRLIARTLLLSADYLGMTAYAIDEQSAQGAGDARRATPSAGVHELFAHAHPGAIVHRWPRTLARMCGRALRPTT